MQPFKFPAAPHRRLHGPAGYTDYESFRPWLRDEFLFRCVYCLRRERWWTRKGTWHIDHWQPQKDHEEKILDYDNLIYSCSGCNLVKGRKELPDPCSCMLDGDVYVHDDGTISGKTKECCRIIEKLGLNSNEDVEFRFLLIGICDMLQRDDAHKFAQLMGYPNDLPDLAKRRPPSNTRPDGISKSCFAKSQRGELPDVY